jgi:hypothetical protein
MADLSWHAKWSDYDERPIEWDLCHCTGDPDDTLCQLHRESGKHDDRDDEDVAKGSE